MRKTNVLLELQKRRRFPAFILALVIALSLAVFSDGLSITSHAESAGRVKSASGANVRSSASSSATVLTSLAQNDVVSIKSQVQGSDGYTWYEVYVNADTLGYIRSDLVEITDGTTPPTSTQDTPSTQQPSNTGTTAQHTAQVSKVNPVSATVINGGTNGVRIRSDASTNSQIVTTVQNGSALTVVGQANGLDTDGKAWYQVNFTSNGSEVSGFIRSDFVRLSEELTPYEEPVVDDEPTTEPDEPPVPTEPEVSKDYETVYQDGEWYLVVTATNKGYVIDEMFDQINSYKEAYEKSEKSARSSKNWIIVLVILLVFAIGAVAFLVYKIRDMMDSAYFNEVERETLHRRGTQGNRKVMQNVGGDSSRAGQGQHPAGTKSAAPGPRPVGTGQRPAGTPQGQRPTESRPPQSQRPAGTPQGQRPTGTPQGQRPAGTPQGQRPTGTPQGQRPNGTPQGQRPTGTPQGQRPAGASQSQSKQQPKNDGKGWQSKNFIEDEEDEFEFDFLKYDEDDEQ